MKHLFCTILFSYLLFGTACTEEENTFIQQSVADYKAAQILSTSTLYENIARQPEMADQLIRQTAALAGYSDITELFPLSDCALSQRGEARGTCLAEAFNAIARQPEAYDKIEACAVRFLGTYEMKIISTRLTDYSRLHAISGMNEALARNPEAADLIYALCKKILGVDLTTDAPAE